MKRICLRWNKISKSLHKNTKCTTIIWKRIYLASLSWRQLSLLLSSNRSTICNYKSFMSCSKSSRASAVESSIWQQMSSRHIMQSSVILLRRSITWLLLNALGQQPSSCATEQHQVPTLGQPILHLLLAHLHPNHLYHRNLLSIAAHPVQV